MPIFDHDGTASHKTRLIFDNDSLADHRISNVFDNDATASQLLYRNKFTLINQIDENRLLYSGSYTSSGDSHSAWKRLTNAPELSGKNIFLRFKYSMNKNSGSYGNYIYVSPTTTAFDYGYPDPPWDLTFYATTTGPESYNQNYYFEDSSEISLINSYACLQNDGPMTVKDALLYLTMVVDATPLFELFVYSGKYHYSEAIANWIWEKIGKEEFRGSKTFYI